MTKIATTLRRAMLCLLDALKSLFSKKADVPEEVKTALRQCENTEQLLDLLFATDFHKDNAFMHLFEKRMAEIDAPF